MKNRTPAFSRPCVKSAFTLIEMLVVLAIIALLSTILFAAVSSVMARANATRSINNLRQMGTGFQLLISDGPPGAGNRPGSFPSYAGLDRNLVAYTWPDLVGRKLGFVERDSNGYRWTVAPEQTIFQSPFRSVPFDPTSGATCAATSGYGYNYNVLGNWSAPNFRTRSSPSITGQMSLFKLSKPEKTVVVAESDGNGRYDHVTWPIWPAASVSDAYKGGGHYLFADWHVEFLDKTEVVSNHNRYYTP